MRRFISSIGITLLALLVSGWGNVLATSMCPHALSRQQAIVEKSVEKSTAHQHDSAQEMDGMKMTPVSSSEHCKSKVAAFEQTAETCAHCFSRSEAQRSLAAWRELTLKKHDAGAKVEPAAAPLASLAIAFTPQFIPTQNAPPGNSSRRHLQISVFLI